jgi:DNA-binding transcriptional LysR family regulator
MQIKWLEDLVAVAKTENISRAAQLRHVTQPAFTRRLQALENWFGAQLVDRSTYPVALTPAGAMFRKLAEQILRDLYDMREKIGFEQKKLEGTIRFSMQHALAVYFFPMWWRNLASGKSVIAKVMADDFKNCVASLVQGQSHLLLCYYDECADSDVNLQHLPFYHVAEEHLIPVCAADSAGRPLYLVPPHSGARLPLLGYASDALLGQVTARLLQQHGVRVDVRYESALAEALKAEALIGNGIAWLPAGLVDDELVKGTLVRVGGSEWTAALDIRLYRAPSAVDEAVLAAWSWAATLATAKAVSATAANARHGGGAFPHAAASTHAGRRRRSD